MISTTLQFLKPYTKSERIAEAVPSLDPGTAEDKRFSSGKFSLLFFATLLLLCTPDLLSGQRKSDVGIFAGTAYYLGDLNTSMHFRQPSIAIGPIFRYNFHPRSSVRLSGIYHDLRSTDPDYNNGSGADFTASFIDLAATFEFNFIPYKTANRKMNYTIYTAAGLGYHYLLSADLSTSEDMSSHLTIPFSLGFKFNINKRLSSGIEWSPRKIFTDNGLDGFSNIGEQNSDFHLFGNNDWYTFAGVFITYKIFNYREDCPTYDD